MNNKQDIGELIENFNNSKQLLYDVNNDKRSTRRLIQDLSGLLKECEMKWGEHKGGHPGIMHDLNIEYQKNNVRFRDSTKNIKLYNNFTSSSDVRVKYLDKNGNVVTEYIETLKLGVVEKEGNPDQARVQYLNVRQPTVTDSSEIITERKAIKKDGSNELSKNSGEWETKSKRKTSFDKMCKNEKLRSLTDEEKKLRKFSPKNVRINKFEYEGIKGNNPLEVFEKWNKKNPDELRDITANELENSKERFKQESYELRKLSRSNSRHSRSNSKGLQKAMKIARIISKK